MGHADVATTMRYLHYAPSEADAELIAEAFAPEPDRPAGAGPAPYGAGDAPLGQPGLDVAAVEPPVAADDDARQRPAVRAGVRVDARPRHGEQLGDVAGRQQRLVQLDVDDNRFGQADVVHMRKGVIR